MATRAQKVKVGVWLTVNLIILVGGLILVSGYRHGERVRHWIEFEESVLGLSTGAVVEYLGVPVGTVDDISVTHNNLAHVEILVDPTKVTLREGVQAKLVMFSFATGVMYISLEGGDPEGSMLAPDAQIPAKPSLVEALRVEFEDIFKTIGELTENVTKGLEGMESGDITRLVDNIDGMVSDARHVLCSAQETVDIVKENIGPGAEEFRVMAKDLSGASREVQSFFAAANEQLAALELDETSAELRTMLQQLNAASAKLDGAIETFETAAGSVAHNADNIEYSLRTGIETVREAFDSLRELVEYLKTDPSALVRGRAEK